MHALKRCALTAFLFLLVVSTASTALDTQTPQAPPLPLARQIPGVNAKDAFPGGCVDCHINRPDLKVGARLSGLMAKLATGVDPALLAKAQAAAPAGVTLKGKHPAVPPGILKNVPAGCMPCHSKASKSAPSFARLLHTLHLGGGRQNSFMTLFQGECTHCHKLDPKSGAWSIPSGPEK